MAKLAMQLEKVAVVYQVPDRFGSLQRKDALTDVSMRVYEGETIGVLGRNGSGKSTLLKVMAKIFESTLR